MAYTDNSINNVNPTPIKAVVIARRDGTGNSSNLYVSLLVYSPGGKTAHIDIKRYEELSKFPNCSNRQETVKFHVEFSRSIISAQKSGAIIDNLEAFFGDSMPRLTALAGQMSPEDLARSMPLFAEISRNYREIAGKDLKLLAMVDKYDADLEKVIADKTLPPANATEFDYENAIKFADNLNLLDIATLSSSITQAVLDKIEENNEMNRLADDRAYIQQLAARLDRKIQDLKVAIRKVDDRKIALKKSETKLALASTDTDKIKKEIAKIVDYYREKPKIV